MTEQTRLPEPLRARSLTHRILRTCSIWASISLFSLVVAVLLFELLYRYQIIDTYNPELVAFNTTADLDGADNRQTILVMGDSFTAGTTGYVSLLRAARPDYRIINSGITATGILEAAHIAPSRFRRFRPSIFIYQVFVGNDLFNINYPISWGRVPATRNLYWLVAQRLRGLGFLNYRLGQIRAARALAGKDPTTAVPPSFQDPFSPESYDQHERIYLAADPLFIEKQVLVRGDRISDYGVFLERLEELLSHCHPDSCTAFVLVIPHASQVHRRYLENLQRAGARFEDPDAMLQADYPFLTGIRTHLASRGLGSVTVLDPMDAFRQSEAAGRAVYFDNDPHLNAEGQALVAELLLQEALREEPAMAIPGPSR